MGPIPSEEHDILLIEGWAEVKRERRGGGRLWALLAAGAEPHPSIPNAWILKEDYELHAVSMNLNEED